MAQQEETIRGNRITRDFYKQMTAGMAKPLAGKRVQRQRKGADNGNLDWTYADCRLLYEEI